MAPPKACVFHRSPEKDYNVLVGDSVELRLRIENCGDSRGNFYSDIRKDGFGWISKYNEYLDPGELGTFLRKSFIMPNREVKVDFYGGHAWSGAWSEDFHYTAYLRPRKEYCTQEIYVKTKDGASVRATIDWGDGTSDSSYTPKTFSHQYEVVVGKSYEIKVSASGYYTESIWLTLPCKPIITSVLPKLTETCSQNVRVVTSDGASVRARLDWGDGVHEDFYTPKTGFYDRYEKGKSYTVRASADGYESASKVITACRSQFTLTLKKVEVPPEYCYQYVRVETSDGKSVTYEITWGAGTWATGSTPDTSMLYCEKGKSYTATATASGYTSASKTFTACTTQFTLTLTKEVEDVGAINVTSSPDPARIWVKPA
ncbi:hypothetical protein KAW18_16055, partial [candidate division WOR-3 bacterium]|nr:hypothetical protein [candidate division WOR-3 bacterium]